MMTFDVVLRKLILIYHKSFLSINAIWGIFRIFAAEDKRHEVDGIIR